MHAPMFGPTEGQLPPWIPPDWLTSFRTYASGVRTEYLSSGEQLHVKGQACQTVIDSPGLMASYRSNSRRSLVEIEFLDYVITS